MQDRVFTAENMAKKNWDCNPTCQLCLALLETTTHLLIKCNYTEAVRNRIADYWELPSYHTLTNLLRPSDWVQLITKHGTKKQKQYKAGVLFYFWWGI